MTREDAKATFKGWVQGKPLYLLGYGYKIIDLIYDKDSRSCNTCKHYCHKPDGGFCGNSDSPCERVSILPYYGDEFYCSLWEAKDEPS